MYLYSAVQICEYLYKYSVAHVFFFLWRTYFCGAWQVDASLKYFCGRCATESSQIYILVTRLLWRIPTFSGCVTEFPYRCATDGLFTSSDPFMFGRDCDFVSKANCTIKTLSSSRSIFEDSKHLKSMFAGCSISSRDCSTRQHMS